MKTKLCILEMSWADLSLVQQLAEMPKVLLQSDLPVLLRSKTAQIACRVGNTLTKRSERLLLSRRTLWQAHILTGFSAA